MKLRIEEGSRTRRRFTTLMLFLLASAALVPIPSRAVEPRDVRVLLASCRAWLAAPVVDSPCYRYFDLDLRLALSVDTGQGTARSEWCLTAREPGRGRIGGLRTHSINARLLDLDGRPVRTQSLIEAFVAFHEHHPERLPDATGSRTDGTAEALRLRESVQSALRARFCRPS